VRQRLCYAHLLAAVGDPAAAGAQFERATAEAGGDPELREDLARARQRLGTGTSAQ
jgi:hypothetical protein